MIRTARPLPVRLAGVLVAAALALTATACSSSDGGKGSDDAKTLTKAQFIKQADAICKKGAAEIAKKSDATDTTKQAELDALVIFAAQNTLDQIADVRALGIPADDKAEIDRAFRTYEAFFKKLKTKPSLINDGTPDDAKAAQKVLSAYGFKECGYQS